MAVKRDVAGEVQRGFHDRWVLRLFEYMVVGVVIAVITGVFLKKVQSLQVEAERMSMMGVVKTLEGAVVLSGTLQQLGLQGDYGRVESGCNPMDLLKERPPGYLGALNVPVAEEIPGGSWYFDVGEKTLVYRVKAVSNFTNFFKPEAQARFQVRERQEKGQLGGGASFVFAPLGEYAWRR